jgi:hypothetical protein
MSMSTEANCTSWSCWPKTPAEIDKQFKVGDQWPTAPNSGSGKKVKAGDVHVDLESGYHYPWNLKKSEN